MAYDPREQDDILDIFSGMLRRATADGGRKREAGEKIPWWRDPAHQAAIFSHLSKWQHGEMIDADSGAHPLVHLAWRALALAWIETRGEIEPTRSMFNPESGRRYHDPVRERLQHHDFAVIGLFYDDTPEDGLAWDRSDPCGRPDCEQYKVDVGAGLAEARRGLG